MKFIHSLLLFILFSTPLYAQDVDLELVLLADTTGSITDEEISFQRKGYADALVSDGVLDAIRYTFTGKIAVTYVEWGDYRRQEVVVPWTIISNKADAKAFTQQLHSVRRFAYGRNAIGAALLKGKELIEKNNISAIRRVIDISGDSAISFNGPSIADARAQVLASNITINGLPILCRNCKSKPTEPDLVERYTDTIIGGSGAFVVTVESMDLFAAAVERKLILEISGKTPKETLAMTVK
ncbi:DUF1194 domain-containing protein [Amylibacter sp. SFDW26]|uniref:DUF1194 domain-containing protein n=1 Tax=Amylibacter sp. SFDW26 TaxID=2652722 RepID=UPI001261CC09|nr:DUF1194 domain-containing protein [Amylibacter sp. SFDW26]KAB7615696.1 DUF1194 domain-containing protein [Amylibacter sp. SFDW26]